MPGQRVRLRGYRRSWLRGDLFAGVTVAAYLIPQVMAYATVAGVPPMAGLWAALPALVIYAALGSSPSLSMGPEATTPLRDTSGDRPPRSRCAGFAVLLAARPALARFPDAALGAIFRRRALAAARQPASPVRWFVLNVEANVEVDFTALEALEAVRKEIVATGGVFALARVKQDLLARLQSFGLADKIGADLIFPTLPTAVQAYRAWAADRAGAGGLAGGGAHRRPRR